MGCSVAGVFSGDGYGCSACLERSSGSNHSLLSRFMLACWAIWATGRISG